MYVYTYIYLYVLIAQKNNNLKRKKNEIQRISGFNIFFSYIKKKKVYF